MPIISDEDVFLIRQELEARAADFRRIWPRREVLTALHRVEGLLERLPKPEAPGRALTRHLAEMEDRLEKPQR
jgi:hypothetical protein